MSRVLRYAAVCFGVTFAGCADAADVAGFSDTAGGEQAAPDSALPGATPAEAVTPASEAATDVTAPAVGGVTRPADGDVCVLSTAGSGLNASDTVPLVGGAGESSFALACLPSVSIEASPDVPAGATGTFELVPSGAAIAQGVATVAVSTVPGVVAPVLPAGGEVTIDTNDGMVLQGSFRVDVETADLTFAGQLMGAFRVTPEGQGY